MTKQPLTPRNRNEGSKRSPTAGVARSSRRTSTTPTTPTSKPASSRRKKVEPPPPPEPVQHKSVWRSFLEDPDALQNLRHHLPSWLDEVFALILIGMGGVAFASLLNNTNSSNGQLAGTVSQLLRQGFGDGSYLVSLGILGAGILVLLPKLGFRIRFGLGQIIALELALFSFQGILHAITFEKETYALAREGEGGGYIGWGVNHLLMSTVGEPANLVILGIILLIGMHGLLGIKRQNYRQVFSWFSHQIQGLAQRLDPEPLPMAVATANNAPKAMEMPKAEYYPDPEPIEPMEPAVSYVEPEPPAAPPPPPQRQFSEPQKTSSSRRRRASVVPRTVEAEPIQIPEPEPIVYATPMEQTPPVVMEEEIEELEPVVQEASTERPALVVNGQVVDLGSMVKERPSIVPRDNNGHQPPVLARPKARHQGGRDDNPNKRYFTVADFAERKKIGKRDDNLPPLELLQDYDLQVPDEEEINLNASIIENTLLEFDLDVDVIDVKVGPVVTQYAVSPIKEIYNPETRQMEITRIRVDKITGLQGDLSLALSAKNLRIEAPVPGHSYVGIEVPNRKSSIVGLRGVLESERFYNKRTAPLIMPMGRDVSGESVMIQLATLPHLLVAGTTGSGKSVFLTSMLTSLIMNNMPEQLQLIMLDPKRVELTRFNGIPHLIGPVETEAERIIGVLRWATREMDRRYKLMELENARNIDAYNAALGRRRKDEHLPYMVIVFDEIGDLMMTHPDETEGTITRLAQKARAAGMHLVIATQRPSTDVVTGLIKANFPGRLSFAVASGVDSRVILDYTGAETLLGRGDMLYLAPDAAGPLRIQGCFVSDEELEEVVLYWRNWMDEQIAEGKLERPRTPPWERGMTRLESLSEKDILLEEAIAIVCEAGEASTSLVQRRLGIGYPRAAHLMDMLYELGIIGPPKTGGRARSVLITNYKQALKKIKGK